MAGDRLYGRGASDMKSGVAAIVSAALQLSRARFRGPGMTVVLVAGEETGCEGSAHLARTPGALAARVRWWWRSPPATDLWWATRARSGSEPASGR